MTGRERAELERETRALIHRLRDITEGAAAEPDEADATRARIAESRRQVGRRGC